MADFIRYVVSMTFRDGINRSSVVSYYIVDAAALTYLNAADDAARAASAVGVLVARTQALTDMVLESTSVGQEITTYPISLPADSVLRGNKLAFSLRSAGRGLTTSVPGRKSAAFSQQVNSLEVSLTTPSAMSNWVTAVENVVVDQFGHGVTVDEGRIVD